MSKGNLFFLLLPCLLIVLPFLMPKEDFLIKIIFIVLGIAIFIAALFTTKKKSSIYVSLKDGRSFSFKVLDVYPREAQKFIDETRKVVSKRAAQQQEAAQELEQEKAAAALLQASTKLE